jgi:hypothetical protein
MFRCIVISALIWPQVIPLLQARVSAFAVQNSLSSLAADVDAANRAIAAQTGPMNVMVKLRH